MIWTDGRVKKFIVNVLRSGATKWPPRYETIKDAYVGKKINEKTNRKAAHYLCNSCNGHFPLKDVEVDHIVPVVDPETGFIDWNNFVERLFCEKKNLQVLCKECHKTKSINERKKNDTGEETFLAKESAKRSRRSRT